MTVMKTVAFGAVGKLKSVDDKIILPLPVVVALQHATIVTGELVLPFIANWELILEEAELSADTLATLAIEFAILDSLREIPASGSETMVEITARINPIKAIMTP